MGVELKQDRIALLVLVISIVGFVSYAVHNSLAEAARAAHVLQQHDAIHRANEERRARLAYAEHLKRAAYDKAHPEEVARRRAAAAAALQVAEAAADAAQARQREAERVAAAAAQAEQAQQNRDNHPCETADSLEHDDADAINAGRMQATYDTAISAIHYNDQCDNSTDKTVNAGYLLSFKAYAEHELGSGDWRTDFNQANALLVECQTLPNLYGTHAAAQCETQETDNIKSVTNWEMNQ